MRRIGHTRNWANHSDWDVAGSDFARDRPRAPLFEDRRGAGRSLAHILREEVGEKALVYGLARGGLPIAAEIARVLAAPLDGIAVAEIGHPHHPELVLGAVAAGGPPALDPRDGWLSEGARTAVDVLVANAEHEAEEFDSALHGIVPPLPPAGAACVIVGDALLRSAPLIAACRWARQRGAAFCTVVAPVGAPTAVRDLASECGAVIVPVVREDLANTSIWRHDRSEMRTPALAELLAAHRTAVGD